MKPKAQIVTERRDHNNATAITVVMGSWPEIDATTLRFSTTFEDVGDDSAVRENLANALITLTHRLRAYNAAATYNAKAGLR